MKLLRVEFHCHTIASKDSLLPPSKLLRTCVQKGIDRVVITDHNSIQGALQAQQLDPERVIIGEEIMTTHGEILAAYVQEEIPAGLPPQEVLSLLRLQGAFISVSHPFDVMRKGHWSTSALLEILPQIDAIEVYNARCLLQDHNRQAQEFAKEHNLAGTVGSDAHSAWELGRATLLLPEFNSAGSLRKSIQEAQQEVRPSPFWVHIVSRYAVSRKQIGKS